ncbi:MAG: hypothetical protein ACREPA_11070 [Candidatus Dormibacteraceae bacterium]
MHDPGQRKAQGIARLGLSHATLQAAIQAQLEESGYEEDAAPIAEAVSAAVDQNNQEILRQLRGALAWEPGLGGSSQGAEGEENPS